jgi:hypothetical protein
MATNVFVNINYPEANIYADLNGIKHDLQSVRDFSLELKNLFQRLNAGERTLNFAYMMDALNIAILIRYGRSFTGGVRKELTIIEQDIITSLSPELQAAHRLFMLLRDKHIAHSVDECEQNRPHARYWLERVKEEGFTSIGCNSERLFGLGTQDVDTMMTLVSALLIKIEERLKKEEDKLFQFVRKKPIEEILKNGNPHVNEPMRIGKPRKQKG